MTPPVVVVGSGLAGLTCARHLARAGREFVLLEAGDQVGGKVVTEVVDGFRLDRGFQVLFTQYPHLLAELDLSKLDLRRFSAGSLVFTGDVMTPVHRDRPLQMALSPAISLGDKFALLRLNRAAMAEPFEAAWGKRDVDAATYLRSCGLSDRFLDFFARPFFGGIFLDRSLGVSARMFAYVWSLLLRGETAVPAQGMGALSAALAGDIPVRTGAKVTEICVEGDRVNGVRLASGEVIRASAVVLAVDPAHACALVPGLVPPKVLASTCLYFAVPQCPIGAPMIALNGTRGGLVNEVVPVSTVAPETAPSGQALVSATVLGNPAQNDEELATAVKSELAAWFPKVNVADWRHLRTHRILDAQIEQKPGFQERLPALEPRPGLHLAGEWTTYSSIDGAMLSGKRAAERILQS